MRSGWRGPEGCEGKVSKPPFRDGDSLAHILIARLLVVGNGNSSNKIAAYSVPLAKSPVYQSIRRPAFPGVPSLPDQRIVMVAPVAKYIVKSTPEGNKIDVKLADEMDILDIDMMQVGTGYKSFPEFIYILEPGDETQHTRSSQSSPYPTASPRSTASSSMLTTRHWLSWALRCPTS